MFLWNFVGRVYVYYSVYVKSFSFLRIDVYSYLSRNSNYWKNI